ncbi:MAG: hypothetical protein QOE90_1656 [Thermoplasmata archaeon]|nr:hypothetical protein [Thermoplasmata archaeon]
MPPLPPPPRRRRATAWRVVLASASLALFGLAALARSWSLIALAAAPLAGALLADPPASRRGGF